MKRAAALMCLGILLFPSCGKRENGEGEKRSAKSERKEPGLRRETDERGRKVSVRGEWHQLAGMETRSWQVSAEFFHYLSGEFGWTADEDDPFGSSDQLDISDFLRRGPQFAMTTGVMGYYDPWTGSLVVRNTPGNVAEIEELIRSAEPLGWYVLDPGMVSRLGGKSSEEYIEERLATSLWEQKLGEIRIPEVIFDDVTLEEAVEFLREKTRELDHLETDESMRGVKFTILSGKAALGVIDNELDREGAVDSLHFDPRLMRVKELVLRDVPVATVLQYLCDSSRLRYRIDHNGVTFLMVGSGDPRKLEERRWRVARVVMERLRARLQKHDRHPGARGPDLDPFGGDDADAEEEASVAVHDPKDLAWVELWKAVGVAFPPGSGFDFDPSKELVVMTGRADDLELIEDELVAAGLEICRERVFGEEGRGRDAPTDLRGR